MFVPGYCVYIYSIVMLFHLLVNFAGRVTRFDPVFVSMLCLCAGLCSEWLKGVGDARGTSVERTSR